MGVNEDNNNFLSIFHQSNNTSQKVINKLKAMIHYDIINNLKHHNLPTRSSSASA